MRRSSFHWLVLMAVVVSGSAYSPLYAADRTSALADAVERRDAEQTRKLLEQQADVNAPQVDGMTALHWAVYHDDRATTTLLLAAGADPRVANRYQVTPLSLACTNGSAEIVQCLLAAGADVNAALPGGEMPLMTASRTGRLECVKLLITHQAEVNAQEMHGQTAIMWAAADGHADVVRELIAAGADFRAPLDSGFTPLLFAARDGRSQVVQVLLNAGDDINQSLQSRRRPVYKPPREGTSPLILAVENGHFELVVELLKAGADPNDQRSGFTPLHTLTWVRKPNRGDDDGDPAPIGSGRVSSLQLVRELVAHGADVNLRLAKGKSGRGQLNRSGATPFLLAAVTADLSLMQLFVELGADPRIPNADNCPPLLAAAGVGTLAPGEEAGTEPEVLAALQFLLDHGADINAVDDNGETAMHGAAYKNLPQVVELLAARGAQRAVWNRPNKYGWTPLSIAQGHRVGNFKPSPPTVAAIERLLD